MSPKDRQLLNDLLTRVSRLERAENISALQMFERNSTFVTESDLAALTLTDLSDVTITSPSNGQVLKYNGTVWAEGTDIDT
jgi:hypothetical protein